MRNKAESFELQNADDLLKHGLVLLARLELGDRALADFLDP